MTLTTADETRAGKPAAISSLAAAFDAFNAVSRELEDSYRTLEREAGRLRRELARANRRNAAEARRHAELARRLAALLEALPGGVLLLDADGCVRHANSAAAELLDTTVLDQPWNAIRERAFLPTSAAQGEVELANGRRVNIAQKPLQPGPGRVLLLTDITEARRIDDLLARHRRLATMGEMAAALAHQIRTPLAAGLLYAGNASRQELPAAQRDAQLAKAVACLHDLERLTADMLQFARGAKLAEQRFDVADLLDSVQTALAPVLTADQTLAVDKPTVPAVLSGNREALAGALINLASNALNAAGANACVRIAARIAGIQAEITVSDNGPGVEAAIRERIFEPFFTSRPDGTGLGLAVARSVARAHRGDVLLVDGTPGRTTFALRLPLASPAEFRNHQHRDVAA
jgi:two-component system sensor histidine kinase FlrB